VENSLFDKKKKNEFGRHRVDVIGKKNVYSLFIDLFQRRVPF